MNLSEDVLIDLKYIYETALKQAKEMTKRVIFVQIMNVVKICIFIGVAIYFNVWWIALFSVLFISKVPDTTIRIGGSINDKE